QSVPTAGDVAPRRPHQRDEALHRRIALHKVRPRPRSRAPSTSIRPPFAAWQLRALSSTARPSPGEALGSALPPRSPAAFPASAPRLVTPHRLGREGDKMNIRLPAATEHPWTDGADGVAARAP